MAERRFMIERFLFLVMLLVGIVLLGHTILIKILQHTFYTNYLTASCGSGVILLTTLYIIAKFNSNVEKQIGNFLYFKGKQHYKELLKEAMTDGLTNLYNHKYFMMRLEEEIERSKRYVRPLSLLMIDIDNFKEYNDTFGHPKGDAVLIKLSEIFKNFSRRVDIPARYGGEEFAIALPETNKKGASALAERLRRSVEAMKFKKGVNITISVGIGFFGGTEAAFTKEDLVKLADDALYMAKANGRNRIEA